MRHADLLPPAETAARPPAAPSTRPLRAALAGMPILKGIGKDTLTLLAGAAERVEFERGAPVFERGSSPSGLYFVVSGGVKLVALGPDSRTRVVELFEPGGMFGEIGVFTGAAYRTWTEAIDTSTLIHVRRKQVLAAVDADHRLATRMLVAVTARTQRLIDSISANGTIAADVRVAAYLLELADRAESADGPLVLPASKGTIASLLNLSQESLSRVFRRMKDAGLLMVAGRRIRIHDRQRLAELMDRDGCAAAAL